MNKKNNDGKTFDDIFSAIAKDEVNQDIISSNDDEIGKENSDVNSNKTFNSIFDKAISTDDSNNDMKSFSDIFNKETIDVSTNKDSEIQDNDSKDTVSFSDIFSGAVKESDSDISRDMNGESASEKSFSDIFSNGNEKENEILENNEVDSSLFSGDVVDENNDVDDKTISDIFANVNEEKKELIVEDVKNQDSSNEADSNIFNKVEEVNDKSIGNKEVDNSLFSSDKVEESDKTNLDIFGNKDEEQGEVVDNPFFSDDNNEDSDKPIDKIDSDIFNNIEEEKNEVVDNPFFNNDKVMDGKDESNIFFDEELSNKSNVEENNNSIKEDNEKEASPFFQDSVVSESNPFFNNTISLVEDSNFSKKDVSGKIDVENVQNFDVKIRKKRPNLVQAVIGVLSYALFIWLLLVGIALLVYVLDIKIRAAKGDTSPPKYGAYVVLTGSMLPEIQVYDVVITKKQDAKDLQEGDVITFASSDARFAGTVITHRIIKKNYSSKNKSYTFQTKGDNNNVADSALVTPENIYGKVILKIPKLGYLRDFLASDGGWILVILFPCLAVVAYDVVKISKGLKKKNYKNIKVQSR